MDVLLVAVRRGFGIRGRPVDPTPMRLARVHQLAGEKRKILGGIITPLQLLERMRGTNGLEHMWGNRNVDRARIQPA
jgi:hypothetical protein